MAIPQQKEDDSSPIFASPLLPPAPPKTDTTKKLDAPKPDSKSDSRTKKPKAAKIFECDILGCGATFNSKFSLQRHYNKHYSKKDFKCKHCDKRFAMPQYRDEHEFTHTGERPYRCPDCNASFRQRGKLSAHRVSCLAQR